MKRLCTLAVVVLAVPSLQGGGRDADGGREAETKIAFASNQQATSSKAGRVSSSANHVEFRRLENNVVLWSRDEELSQPPILLHESDAVVIAFRRDEYHYIEVIDKDGAVRWGKRVSDYSAHAPTVAASDTAIVVLPGILVKVRAPIEGVQSLYPESRVEQWRKQRIVVSLNPENGKEIWSSPEADIGYPLVMNRGVLWTYRLENPIESFAGHKQKWLIEHRDSSTGKLLHAWHLDGKLQDYTQFWRMSESIQGQSVRSVGMVSEHAPKESSGYLWYDAAKRTMAYVLSGVKRQLRSVTARVGIVGSTYGDSVSNCAPSQSQHFQSDLDDTGNETAPRFVLSGELDDA